MVNTRLRPSNAAGAERRLSCPVMPCAAREGADGSQALSAVAGISWGTFFSKTVTVQLVERGSGGRRSNRGDSPDHLRRSSLQVHFLTTSLRVRKNRRRCSMGFRRRSLSFRVLDRIAACREPCSLPS